eukprot:904104_1
MASIQLILFIGIYFKLTTADMHTIPPTQSTNYPTTLTSPPTQAPSFATANPTIPTNIPSTAPTAPTSTPTAFPTGTPTHPTFSPTAAPTPAPTPSPTPSPTDKTKSPTKPPTGSPTREPTRTPTTPTTEPTLAPTPAPTMIDTVFIDDFIFDDVNGFGWLNDATITETPQYHGPYYANRNTMDRWFQCRSYSIVSIEYTLLCCKNNNHADVAVSINNELMDHTYCDSTSTRGSYSVDNECGTTYFELGLQDIGDDIIATKHQSFHVSFELHSLHGNDLLAVSGIKVHCGSAISSNPTTEPTKPSLSPTSDPTYNPSFVPTSTPSRDPSLPPTYNPTMGPTSDPSPAPTLNPIEGIKSTRSRTESDENDELFMRQYNLQMLAMSGTMVGICICGCILGGVAVYFVMKYKAKEGSNASVIILGTQSPELETQNAGPGARSPTIVIDDPQRQPSGRSGEGENAREDVAFGPSLPASVLLTPQVELQRNDSNSEELYELQRNFDTPQALDTSDFIGAPINTNDVHVANVTESSDRDSVESFAD